MTRNGPRALGFAEQGITEHPTGFVDLLRLDARELHHLAPLLDFVRDELAEVGGRVDKRRGSHVGDPRLDSWIGKSCVEFLIELVDNLDGRVLGSADPEPSGRLEWYIELTWPDGPVEHIDSFQSES